MGQEVVTKEEAVRLALAQLGDVSAPKLVRFIEQRYGLKIDPKFVPVLKATLRAKEQVEHFRAKARAISPERSPDGPFQAA
jgi:hypothetical protein